MRTEAAASQVSGAASAAARALSGTWCVSFKSNRRPEFVSRYHRPRIREIVQQPGSG